MPTVPTRRRPAPPPPKIDPTFLDMALAAMHKEGKLPPSSPDQPQIPVPRPNAPNL